MRIRSFLLCLVWLALALPVFALQPPQPTAPKVYGYATWSDTHFLFAARVESGVVSGTSTEEQVFPSGDDGIELCFNVPTASGRHVTARLAISVAGGFTVLAQDETGRWKTENSWVQPPAVLKFDAKVDGTLNIPSDTDRGYTVEVAIPWERLGGAPKPMSIVGFNFLTRIRGEGRGFVSWSPMVLSEEDTVNPAKWGQMILFPGSRPAPAERGAFACPQTGRMPLIDGTLAATEWFGAGIITLQKPIPEVKPIQESKQRRDDLPVLMSLYRYDYHGDASSGTWIQQPREGVGPWFDGRRPAWHRDQLRELQRSGVEIILPVYAADPQARADWSRRGLLALVSALRDARNNGRSYPMMGMYLDVASVVRALGDTANLTTPRGRQLVYGAIREFYTYVPTEFRADIEPAKGEKGYLVVLGAPSGISAWDDSFISYANEAFAHDFNGAKLVWMADPAWKTEKLKDLYAYPSLSGGQPSIYDGSGKAGVAVISPGYSDQSVGMIRPAGEGPELREEWRRMLALNPDYVIINSWNDYVKGTSVAPTRQQGLALVDTLALLISAEAENIKLPVKLRKVSMPSSVPSGGKGVVELVLANTSASQLMTDQYVGLDMRITDAAGKSTLTVQKDVAPFRIQPGGSTRILVPFEARRNDRTSIPKGNYLLQFELRRSQLAYLKSTTLFGKPLASFTVPLQIDTPTEGAFTILGSTLHTQLKSGARYTANVTLRNDGTRKWRRGETRIAYQWYRVDDDLEGINQTQRLGDIENATTLENDIAPGEVATIQVTVNTEAGGKDLDTWQPGSLWHYEIAWIIKTDEHHKATQPLNTTQVAYIYSEDIGARFVDSTTPRDMAAGKQYEVQLIVNNVSGDTWQPGQSAASAPAGVSALVYRWYFWDGRPTQWSGFMLPIDTPVKPGDSAKLTGTIVAPPYGGSYYLAWELSQGGNYSSRSLNTNGEGMLVVPVSVTDGLAQTVDLSAYLNVVASATDRRRTSADFDGLGNSLPLETLPPDLSGNFLSMYPAGYYVPSSVTNADAAHEVPFRYPEKNNGLAKAVACSGQTIAISNTLSTKVHILGAGTGANLLGTVIVTFADGRTQSVPLMMSSWLELPTHGETVAYTAPYLRGSREDSARQQIYLHHYVISLPTPGDVSSITLPDNPEMKIFAITLESPSGKE